jgi:[FeFe] hydrogenase H-cluster maturation GTPase HydF
MAQMNETPSGRRTVIALFGRRNVGKSSLLNAITGQNVALVSDVKGTTTDPVSKAMELLPLGPVLLIDTPGVDDEGELGQLRVARTMQTLKKTDVALLITDNTELRQEELALIDRFRQLDIPHLVVYSKADLCASRDGLWVSAVTGEGIDELRQKIAGMAKNSTEPPLVADLVEPGDVAVLVVPIDKAAPKGRLILPQQQVIREMLDTGAVAMVCRDTELADTLGKLNAPPKLVITDSQVFGKVNSIVPDSVPLTSFSILMARYKGNLPLLVAGASAVDSLQNGDRVLIAEGCTHHRQCEDIGTVKLPNWIRKHTGAEPEFHFCSGGDFPEDLSRYKMVVHCGGCMQTRREMEYRLTLCQEQGIPVTNYGVLIAYLNGILPRTLTPFA